MRRTRNISVSTDVTRELAHKGHAETPDLVVRLSLGVKVGTSFSSTHAETSQSILECLLKTEELEDGQVDGRVKTEATLVGSKSRVVLRRT